MKKLILIFAIGISCIACSGTKKTINPNLASVPASERDGSSYEKAIIIAEQHETPGINAEYLWIKKQYPGSKTAGQSLTYHDKKPFDIINIVTSDGKSLAVYFDISNFYGKF